MMSCSRHYLCVLFLVLVVFLYSVSSQEEKEQKNYHKQLPTKMSNVDLEALREIKNSLTDIRSASSNFFSSWDFTSPADPCSSFAGVTCSTYTRRVTTLTLGTGLSADSTGGLAGTLSPSISKLSELTQLILYAGIVTGPLPLQIGALKNLKVLSLTNNRLTGTIPASICNLRNLHTVDLSGNRLTGPISPCIYLLRQLKVLVLASNMFSGELPLQLPPHLLHLDFKNNRIGGTLARRRKLPLSIRYLSASANRMWGPLNGLESLSELVYLDLSMNNFNGPIPASLFRPTLTSMFLQRNNLSGRVPLRQESNTTIYYYSSKGSIIDLSHNYLSGELTSGLLVGVESLFLNNNRFTGRVPEEYVKSVFRGSIRTLYLQHNYITQFPVESEMALPGGVSLCLSYNCMVPPPVGISGCPTSAGQQLSRPAYQCSSHSNNGS